MDEGRGHHEAVKGRREEGNVSGAGDRQPTPEAGEMGPFPKLSLE